MIALVSLRASSKSCRNTILKFSAEISKTLETLGPKSQNAQNCNLRLARDVLKEVVHTYVLFSLNIQVLSAGNPQKSRL
jgi:hypothetical protein